MKKNVAGQKIYVFAYSSLTSSPVTGDAGNITAVLSLDGAATAAIGDTNPTEIGGGLYAFDATQAETNADTIAVIATSATSNVLVLGSPQVIHTRPANFPDLGINASGHISRVVLVDTTTTNTDMRGTDSAYTGTPPTAGAISTQVAADLQTAHGAGSWQTATGFSTLTAAGVWQEDLGELALTGTMAGRKLNNIEDDTNELQGNQGDWATATGFSTLDAAGVRTAVGLASANLDTQLSDIDSAIGNIDVTGVIAMPLTADIPDRTQGRTIDVYTGETVTLAVAVRDINGDTVDLSGSDYDFLVWDKSQTTQIEATAAGTSTGFSVTITPGTTPAQWQWAVRRQNATKERLAGGPFDVHYTPSAS